MKRAASLILVFFLSAGLVSCGEKPEPEYQKNGALRLAAFQPPPPENTLNFGNEDFCTEENYRILKDCGYNYVYSINDRTESEVTKTLALCEKFGLKAYISDMFDETSVTKLIKDTSFHALTAGQERTIEDRISAYCAYPSFAGIIAVDEPRDIHIANIGILSDFYQKYFSRYDYFINFNPIVAFNSKDEYERHIDGVFKAAKLNALSFDYYPLQGAGENYKTVGVEHLRNLSVLASKSKEFGVPFYTYIQTIGHMNYRTLDNYDDIAWQVYSAMAFGTTGIQTFTYWTTLTEESDVTYGLISREGEITPTYHAVRKVFEEVKFLETYYTNFEWEGVLTGTGEEAAPVSFEVLQDQLEPQKYFERLDVSGATLIGVFQDKEGRNGYMFVNYADPFYDKTDEVRIKFRDGNNAVIVKNLTKNSERLRKRELKIQLKSGECCFVIPY